MRQHRIERVAGNRPVGQMTEGANRPTHLVQGNAAERGARQVLVETTPLGVRQRTLEVVRHQLHEFLAGHLPISYPSCPCPAVEMTLELGTHAASRAVEEHP